MRNMPFANLDESFGDLTIDYDMGTNMILALDRGEMPQPNPYDDHKYMIKRLVHRMRMADFKLLPPEVQQAYQQTKDHYQQLEVRQQQMLLAAQNEFIPTGGSLVKVDFYITKPGGKKPERALLPHESLNWLVQRLADQGSSQEQLQQVVGNEGALAEMAQQLLLKRAQPGPQQG